MTSEAIKHGHAHGEAFMLMAYACECGHREIIWNSRDGVTPFGLSCPSCGGLTLMHVDWRSDTYAPGHKLHKGQRYWRDGTPDEAEAIMRCRIEMMKDKYPLAPEQAERLIRECREGTDGGEFQKGWPTIGRYDGIAARPDAQQQGEGNGDL